MKKFYESKKFEYLIEGGYRPVSIGISINYDGETPFGEWAYRITLGLIFYVIRLEVERKLPQFETRNPKPETK